MNKYEIMLKTSFEAIEIINDVNVLIDAAARRHRGVAFAHAREIYWAKIVGESDENLAAKFNLSDFRIKQVYQHLKNFVIKNLKRDYKFLNIL